jgi:hypothetical protein
MRLSRLVVLLCVVLLLTVSARAGLARRATGSLQGLIGFASNLESTVAVHNLRIVWKTSCRKWRLCALRGIPGCDSRSVSERGASLLMAP